MPFKPFKENKEWCVWRVDEAGEKVKKVGCGHKSKKAAIAQIGAIESELRKKGEKMTDINLYVSDSNAIEFVNTVISTAIETTDNTTWGKWTVAPYEIKEVGDVTLVPVYVPEETPPEEEDEIDNRYAIKALGQNRVGGYAILWGDKDSKDLHGEYFTPETKDVKAIFDALGVVPFVVHHALDDKVEKFVAGKVDVMEEDDEGLWWEATTKEFEAYRKYVQPLMKKSMAYTSTGTMPAAKRATKSGEITRWVVSEVSATWTPAEFRMLEHPISEVKSAFAELGLEDVDLTEYVDKPEKEEPEPVGVEKARIKALVEQELLKLKLLELV